jgi:energy-coupling factor transporter ATP-binding protein EcfA2
MRFDHEHRTVITAIRTKPFILLAGISGTGKSRLVRSLAYLTCSDPALQHRKRPGNFELVMVKPNWHDPTELMGYVSRITGAAEYVPKDFLRFVVRAWEYPHVPFFLCLDEMNLAPVEQYFADFLSVVETRRRNAEGQVITDALLKADASVPAPVFEDLLGKLGLEPGGALWDRFMNDGITLPPNLVVMGTVNMDETTHSFSRKVLDRAMTFEMNEVDLRSGLGQEDEGWRYPETPLVPNWVLGTVTRGGEVPPTTEGYNETLVWLEKMNREVLEGTPFNLAYVFHNAHLAAKPKEWLATCLDELLVMKVLSRIEGDEGKVKDVLDKLLALVPEQWPHSTRKLKEMKARLERSGYTSFWS